MAIDYPAALVEDLPTYMLTPEVSALLHNLPAMRRKMLFTTLWNTGARISEALVLTRGDFLLRQHYPFVQLAILKQREDKAESRDGRREAGVVPYRLVPVSDAQYLTQLEMIIAIMLIPQDRHSEKRGRTERVRLWEGIDRTTRTWLNEAVESAGQRGIFLYSCYPAHFLEQLRYAHALCRHAAKVATEPYREQEH